MRKALLALLTVLWSVPSFARDGDGGPWFYEFEFSYNLPGQMDRLLAPECTKVVPVEVVDWYYHDRRPGWEISCGNRQPMYFGTIGRRCWQWGRVLFECLARHVSSPKDANEITFDGVGIRGRIEFGKGRSK